MATNMLNSGKSAFIGSDSWNHGGWSYHDITDNSNPTGETFSDAFGRTVNMLSGKTAMAQADAAEAQKNRDWQEYMSNTAHQREVEDLHAAGLNPASMDGGAGASTPQGAQGHADSSGNGILQFLGAMARSAVGAVMTRKMIEAGAADHGEYRKMMGEYYSAKNALQQEKNDIAWSHEGKNCGFNMSYSGWKG